MIERLRPWHIGLGLFLIGAVTSYFWMVGRLPGMAAGKTLVQIEAGGAALHSWSPLPPPTPLTQRLPAPAPELATAVCRFDVTGGPVEISVPNGKGISILTIHNHRGDLLYSARLRPTEANAEPGHVVAAASGQMPDEASGGLPVVPVKAGGLAVLRRIARDDVGAEEAAALLEMSVCGPFSRAN